MSQWVLDASAILAFLNKEPGTEKVALILAEGAIVSTVNHSEVIAKLIEAGVPEAEVRVVLGYLNYTIINFDEESAWATARLRTLTKTVGLSLGDHEVPRFARSRLFGTSTSIKFTRCYSRSSLAKAISQASN
ncbi:MAG: hypothetical protein Kow0049_33080 [Stanieria sp.]